MRDVIQNYVLFGIMLLLALLLLHTGYVFTDGGMTMEEAVTRQSELEDKLRKLQAKVEELQEQLQEHKDRLQGLKDRKLRLSTQELEVSKPTLVLLF